MSQQTILICDGCELPDTKRKPVIPFELDMGPAGEMDAVIEGDAHDWNCVGRVISRKRKAIREAAKAENDGKAKTAKK